MSTLLRHLPVLPIVLPLISGALLLFLPQQRTVLRSSIALLSTLAQVAIAAYLLHRLIDPQPGLLEHGVEVYVLGGWVAPYGIVLVVDRLSALMLALNAAIALPVHVYSLAHWDRVGVHYHSMLQFLLMGLNGAFLTGDLFNLFVFFEILLSASYGLLLHGSNAVRVKAGLHYVAVNLAGSLIFLIGVALIYGVAGTLNMADLGVQWAAMAPERRSLFEAGVGILGIAFLIKAGIWPLNFWLPKTYTAASPPVAAMFAIMTKVGVYALLRMGSLLAIPEAPAPFAGPWLFYGTVATMWFGIVGMLAARQLTRLVAFSVIASSGTLLAVIALGVTSATAPVLLYLIASVPAGTAFFLIAGMTERLRVNSVTEETRAPQPTTYTAFMAGEPHEVGDNELDEVGVAIPAALAFLGMAFVSCTLLTTGMPPLVGFMAKFSIISALLGAAMDQSSLDAWLLIVSLLAAGFAGLIALTKRGMRSFWSTGRTTPRLRFIEAMPVAFLILLCVTMTIAAGPVMNYLDSAAEWLHEPNAYIHAVLPTREVSP
ncbi:monovalent cation/H+ antiporter subunit D [Peristeroidobacter agariperforans]|uniref:monovalent cation/H+ antiporter subunit D n=1 Tax=Peristeroidobacter agariperforans TaxID=268404 RepID=UPI00101D57C6|nr:monovalent cation/H+ antiporter subunit D [Peristeroidobacter agariperforans]